jgi:hypothetical protein
MTKSDFRFLAKEMQENLSGTVGATEPISAQVRPFDATLADLVKGIEVAQAKTFEYLSTRIEPKQ